jgi:hypothetical protein
MAGSVFLGLNGQSLYLLFFGWSYFHPEDRIGQLWFTSGGWCSIFTFVVAWSGSRLKRYAGLASGVYTLMLKQTFNQDLAMRAHA